MQAPSQPSSVAVAKTMLAEAFAQFSALHKNPNIAAVQQRLLMSLEETEAQLTALQDALTDAMAEPSLAVSDPMQTVN